MNQPLSQDALNQLFNNARSYNGYLDKPVTEAQLRAIWDLMKMGPTSVNMLPARLVWCVSPQAKEKKGTRKLKSNFIATLGYGNSTPTFARSPRPEFGKFNRIN